MGVGLPSIQSTKTGDLPGHRGTSRRSQPLTEAGSVYGLNNKTGNATIRDYMGSPAERYVVRLMEPADVDRFLSLYETVFGGGTRRWFDWKYRQNPYVDHLPIFIAEAGDEIAGARPFTAFELLVDGDRVVGLQTSDTMVHPEHRRRGLFTSMTERAFEYYGDLPERVVTFNVPNAISRPGYLELGCGRAGRLAVEYRLQRASSFLGEFDGAPKRIVGGVLDATIPVAQGIMRGLIDPAADMEVLRHESIPVNLFTELYRRSIPRPIHAHRQDRFYEWRFGNPNWRYTAYTAHRDGEPVAGAIAGSRSVEGRRTVAISELVPLEDAPGRADGLTATVAAIIDDANMADVIVLPSGHLPRAILRHFGFLPDDSRLLERFTTPTVLIAGTLHQGGRIGRMLGDVDLLDLDNWRMTLSERNTN